MQFRVRRYVQRAWTAQRVSIFQIVVCTAVAAVQGAYCRQLRAVQILILLQVLVAQGVTISFVLPVVR